MSEFQRYCFVFVIATAMLASTVPVGAEEPEYGNGTSPASSGGGGGYHEDPCRDIWENSEHKREELRMRQDEEWRKYEENSRAFWESNHTEEEAAAFERQDQQRAAEMEQRHKREWEELEAGFRAECEARMEKYGGYKDPYGGRGSGADTRPRPDGYRPDGPMYGDEPHRAPPPSGPYGDDPCREVHESTNARFDEIHQRFQAEREAMAGEYDAFYQSGNFTPEEEQQFRDRMRQKEDEMRNREQQAFRQIEDETRDKCRQLIKEHRADERAERRDEDKRRMAREMRDVSPEMQAAMEEMYLIQESCEEQAWALEEDFQAQMEAQMDAEAQRYDAAGTGPGPAHHGPDPALQREFESKMRQHWDSCDAKMRALWETKVGAYMDEGERYDRMGSWQMEERDGQIFVHGKYMSLTGDPESSVISRVAVSGQTYIDAIETESDMIDGEADESDRGSVLKVHGDDFKILFHDNPAGLIRFQAFDGGAIYVGVQPGFDVARVGNGWAITNGDARALLQASGEDASYDEEIGVFTIVDDANFLLPDHADNKVLQKVGNKHRGEISQAVADGNLGAEVTLLTDDEGEAFDDTLTYEDVDVVSDADPKERSVEIVVSSDTLEEGKTFVVNVDTDILSLDAELDVLYYDIDEDSGAASEAKIQRASSLLDVLDPTDDDTAEYWLVQDLDGFQVIFSVPHWSTHKIVVQSGEAADEGGLYGVPGPGIAMMLAVAALGAVVMSRRRD